MATDTTSSDRHMAQFFDFGEAAVPEAPLNVEGDLSAIQRSSDCAVHGLIRDVNIPVSSERCTCRLNNSLSEDGRPATETEWNSDFSSWLPRYQKPTHPCHYCDSKGLECFIFNPAAGKVSGCSPCNALFRPCSFTNPEKMPFLRTKTALDTLDVVTEDTAQCFGGRTGRKPMRMLGHAGPIVDDLLIPEATKKGAATRFSRDVVKILKNWLIQHADHPYPTEEEKEALKAETGLTVGQISNWMANTRRRQKARPKRDASPSLRPSTRPVNIPPGRTWDDLNPLERWKHSPPENEPAPLTAIAQAVETFDPPQPDSLSSSYNGGKLNSNDSTGSFSVFRAPSITSLETGFTHVSSGSGHSYGSAYSYGSRNSLGSLNSLNSKKERRRRRRLPTRNPKLDLDHSQRLFQCTFCTDRFKSKYDWSRHEKSLHLSLEKWICAPLGDVITCTATGRQKCVYCDALDPSKEHLATHNHSACEEKGLEARTFYRKDHLSQHLRLMHGCKITPSMESWKAEVQYINSRCGFCGMTFTKWQDRVDHLAKEFRTGAQMKDWKGCRGLDANVAALVTQAMPPYLIANESKSPVPFSATNRASRTVNSQHAFLARDLEYLIPNNPTNPATECHLDGGTNSNTSSNSPTTASHGSPNHNLSSSASPQSSRTFNPNPNATCWEILTLRLGQYSRLHIARHGAASLTDEMLQSEARRILYDSDDPWNQTAADNPEWLGLFKKAHGIGNAAPMRDVVHQHDVLEDLGLGADAQLDPSFNLDNFKIGGDEQALAGYECSLTGSMNISKTAMQFQNLNFDETGAAFGVQPTSSFDQYLGLNAPISQLDNSRQPSYLCSENKTASSSTSADFQSIPASLEMPRSSQQFPLPEFSDWNRLSTSTTFSLPHTTTGWLSSSLPVTLGSAPAPASTSADVIQGSIGNPQVMRWDDNEVGFGMDLDLDMDMNVDMRTGSS